MSLLSILGLGKQAGDAIATPVEAIGNVLDKLFTSDEEKEHARYVMETLRQKPQELQIEINKLESQHRSIFVAGWRPAIGWVLAISLGIYYIPQFATASYLWIWACIRSGSLVSYPISEISGLLELVLAMLGMAGYRTVEKLSGRTK
jgi:hypothetical protein